MFRKLMRVVAYVRAPVKTFVVLHPIRALRWGATYLVVKKTLEMRRRPT